jgi:glucose/arabinose dehydrogenase
MTTILSRSWTLLFAALAGGLAAAAPAAAQQSPASQAPATASAPASPSASAPSGAAEKPSWMQAMPDNPAAADLAPVVPPPIATAADKLPVAKLHLPKNFQIEVYASGIPDARSLRVDDNGTVFVSNRRQDKVYAIVDRNGKREVKIVAKGLNSPNGIALRNGTLYIAEINRISKIDNIETQLDNPPQPTVV